MASVLDFTEIAQGGYLTAEEVACNFVVYGGEVNFFDGDPVARVLGLLP